MKINETFRSLFITQIMVVLMNHGLMGSSAWSTITSSRFLSGLAGMRYKNKSKKARSSVIYKCRRLHQSTVLRLNRFLFDPSEIDSPPTGSSNSTSESTSESNDTPVSSSIFSRYTPTVTLPKQDYRTIHAAKVLGLQNGDTLRAGIVQDNIFDFKTTSHNSHTFNNKYNKTISDSIPPLSFNSETYGGLITDDATIRWIPEGKIKKAQPTKNGDPPGSLEITLNSLASPTLVEIDADDDDASSTSINTSITTTKTDESPQISLILALPRPLALARLLPMISMMGIHHLVLTSAQKVPKDYFGSHLFRKPNEIRKLLIEGLCQAGDVKIPTVTVVKRLKPFLEDDLDALFPKECWARVIAHPLRKDGEGKPLRMEDIAFPSSSCSGSGTDDGGDDTSICPRILLAVGPEGGWLEPHELDMFQSHDFQQITLGSRILRSDVAVVSLLSLAHDVCARR